jgi:16S rRNA (cytidine1402-2'-O)-methyltransferase
MTIISKTQTGTLYVVATPIGNLADLTERAREVLARVDQIACEDTRHSSKLLQHLGLRKPLLSVHEHNERERVAHIASLLSQGQNLALISDAGTPLISDPGFPLVQALREQGFQVSPVPGVSAVITALSAAGLPTDRFTFEGFLPHKMGGKREKLEALAQEPRTMVFYEAKHRILETLELMAEVFGTERPACVARELTKTFETFYHGTLPSILARLSGDEDQQKGEFVVMITGHPNPSTAGSLDSEKLLRLLSSELPPKKAAALVAEVTGENKKELYDRLLRMKA